MSRVSVCIALALASGACLGDQQAKLDCGQGGDAFAFSGSDYCIYTSAIIIEGFDCPAMVPFPHESDGLVICGPTEDPPPEGWDELVDAWQEQGAEPDGFDTSLPEDTSEDTSDSQAPEADTGPNDTGPTDPGPCVEGLEPGRCWDASMCPTGWLCDGASISCTPCVDCAEPISGTPGSCRPDPTADALGLVAWPGDAPGGETLIAYFWIANASYALLECPAFSLELGDGTGGFSPGPVEAGCDGAIAPTSETVITRAAPMPEVRTDGGVRVKGRYRSGCFSSDPAACTGTVELTSGVVVLPP